MFEGPVILFQIPLVDYMYEFIYNPFLGPIFFFLGFEAISEICYKLWSKAKLWSIRKTKPVLEIIFDVNMS